MSAWLLIHDQTIDEICVIHKQEGEIYCHKKAHVNTFLQYSSYCCTIHEVHATLPWWALVHVVEYLYFCGLTCTPVTPWFAMKEMMCHYPTHEPSCSLTELLANLCKGTQGGIDRATGHQFTSSARTGMTRNVLFVSLHNMQTLLLESNV